MWHLMWTFLVETRIDSRQPTLGVPPTISVDWLKLWSKLNSPSSAGTRLYSYSCRSNPLCNVGELWDLLLGITPFCRLHPSLFVLKLWCNTSSPGLCQRLNLQSSSHSRSLHPRQSCWESGFPPLHSLVLSITHCNSLRSPLYGFSDWPWNCFLNSPVVMIGLFGTFLMPLGPIFLNALYVVSEYPNLLAVFHWSIITSHYARSDYLRCVFIFFLASFIFAPFLFPFLLHLSFLCSRSSFSHQLVALFPQAVNSLLNLLYFFFMLACSGVCYISIVSSKGFCSCLR